MSDVAVTIFLVFWCCLVVGMSVWPLVTGKISMRGHVYARRAEQPRSYWLQMAAILVLMCVWITPAIREIVRIWKE